MLSSVEAVRIAEVAHGSPGRVVCARGLCVLVPVGWGAAAAAGSRSAVRTPWTAPASCPWPGVAGVLEDLLAEPLVGHVARGPPPLMAPTGIELVNAHGVDSMVVDGTRRGVGRRGMAVEPCGPGYRLRADWDVADDATFATMWAIRPSGGPGCGSSTIDRLRLFDGRRFVRDLAGACGLIAAIRMTPPRSGPRCGSAAPPASPVARRAERGRWWGRRRSRGAGCSLSTPWGSSGPSGRSSRRARAATWWCDSTAGGGAPPGGRAPQFAEDIVADPTGESAPASAFGARFDGTSWRRTPPAPHGPGCDGPSHWYGRRPGRCPLGGRSARPVPSRHSREDGRSDAGPEVPPSSGWASWPRRHRRGLVGPAAPRGNRLSRIWANRDPGIGAPVEGLLVVSSDEAWARGRVGDPAVP